MYSKTKIWTVILAVMVLHLFQYTLADKQFDTSEKADETADSANKIVKDAADNGKNIVKDAADGGKKIVKDVADKWRKYKKSN